MTDWKEEMIADCISLEARKVRLEDERREDIGIKNVETLLKKAVGTISELEQPYNDKIGAIDARIKDLHDTLVTSWDITDKTYECEVGTATLRTTKALKIGDKKRLIQVLLNIDKLPEAIRSWNLSYLRKLKDVDMIEDTIACYDEHQNVVIKGVSDK